MYTFRGRNRVKIPPIGRWLARQPGAFGGVSIGQGGGPPLRIARANNSLVSPLRPCRRVSLRRVEPLRVPRRRSSSGSSSLARRRHRGESRSPVPLAGRGRDETNGAYGNHSDNHAIAVEPLGTKATRFVVRFASLPLARSFSLLVRSSPVILFVGPPRAADTSVTRPRPIRRRGPHSGRAPDKRDI